MHRGSIYHYHSLICKLDSESQIMPQCIISNWLLSCAFVVLIEVLHSLCMVLGIRSVD